ncbi:MAG: LapA family protein [Rhizobiales bacterium]|jgi:uncharacterized integral membrane protein|nr:LapA family protein [Hyphomicrobiales bacterium]OJU37362.1 MAG: DUF1049 domain-containing protein [Rhizobiales bacterium 68-8]
MNRVLTIVVLVPLAIILIALAVANRGAATFTIDPFNPGNPGLSVEWPLFVLLFVALGVGLLLGSAATWLRQGRYRKAARERASEVRALRDQAMRATPPQPTLPKPGA